ncbi:uncharacterized protein [Parasteatoda tepidariorum]|uniref:uncharacterized protein isoform X1 n=1 Tax=Parasteatoda tepidariorum TaxID=114398 RepID=UPI001C7196AB|nr:uncharacterized protein LOC107444336 isoform X2 [Parasteatoda tepidariorum]XP_042907206.1 uncharacterized protein LOC107444336 isoform X3 [Parasteatoda tepidariorum]
MEYRLVKEEMALLSYQEQHWESAALWDVPPPLRMEEMWEPLHDYITYLKERGAVPALHASEHVHLEKSLLVSCQSDGAPIPKVEWAHQDTELQNGDRLVEVNGHIVIGKNSSEVCKMLMSSSRGVCRVVYLRPLSLYQMMKNSGGGKETSNLRQELATVVTRLNQKMMENAKLKENNFKLQEESRKLKLQLVSLQSILLYMFQVMDSPLPPSVYDLLRNGSSENIVCKRFPSLPISPDNEEKSEEL